MIKIKIQSFFLIINQKVRNIEAIKTIKEIDKIYPLEETQTSGFHAASSVPSGLVVPSGQGTHYS
jgi:hypothetical protein